MDILLINYLNSISVLPAAIIGLARIRQIGPDYYPIVLLWWLVVINETIRFISIHLKVFSLMGYNIFALVALCIYVWQYYRWGLFGRHKKLYRLLLAGIVVFWIADHFLLPGSSIHERRPYFRLMMAIIIVALAVTHINHLIATERKSLLRNAQFIISLSLAIYYTFRVLTDVFSMQGMSQDFLKSLSDFNRYMLQVMYIPYLLAALWMPKRKSFILPLS